MCGAGKGVRETRGEVGGFHTMFKWDWFGPPCNTPAQKKQGQNEELSPGTAKARSLQVLYFLV